MSDPTKFDFKNTANSVPKAYDDLLVPRLFEPWVRVLLEEANLDLGEEVLDVACGPGTVARMAAERVGLEGKVTATDISPLMLDIALSKPHPKNGAKIDYKESPASPLKASDDSFDLTLCQQGLQFFPDKVEALKEMARVTKPGGRLVVAVWRPIEDNPIVDAVYKALTECIPQDIAEMMKAPFSLGEEETLKSICEEAGLKNVEVKSLSIPLIFEKGVDQAARFLEATPLAPSLAQLPSDKQNTLSVQIRKRLSQFLDGGKCCSTSSSNIILSSI